jgi:hypothetical protein
MLFKKLFKDKSKEEEKIINIPSSTHAERK